jgi:streptomycin 6-kinase
VVICNRSRQASVIPQRYLDKAKEVNDYLLKSSGRELVLHGDLHLENILNNGLEWLAIDPKGIIGEIEFEVAAFDLIDNDEIARYKSIANIVNERITMLAAVTGVDESRLTAWIYLRIIMSALWFIEDNGDPAWPLMMAGQVYLLVG